MSFTGTAVFSRGILIPAELCVFLILKLLMNLHVSEQVMLVLKSKIRFVTCEMIY